MCFCYLATLEKKFYLENYFELYIKDDFKLLNFLNG